MRFLTFLIFITFCVLISGCANDKETHSTSGVVDQQTEENQALNSEVESYSLIFKPVAAAIPLSEMKENQIENNISSDKIDSYTVLFYSKKGDTENLYSAIQIESIKYEIGKIGYQPVQDPSVFGMKAVSALSKNLIKVTGFCGANCPITDYIQVQDSTPYKLLHLEANTVEADVNEDNILEIVETVGTAATTSIYRLNNNDIEVADIHSILNATVVLYDKPSNTFVADGQHYKSDGDNLVLVR